MKSFAFWNNKGGVGKSFLCFVVSAEYARIHEDRDVYVIDMCPQANVSEALLGGYNKSSRKLDELLNSELYRRTIAGYLNERLSSPFEMLDDITGFVCTPHDNNSKIPPNLHLVCGDNLVELLSDPIREQSQLTRPREAWKKVLTWVKDLVASLRQASKGRKAIFFIDCNPSFAIYTQLALVAADFIMIPFTADDSSRRGIENIVSLLYGLDHGLGKDILDIGFHANAEKHSLKVPLLHTFVSNRVTLYRNRPSMAFEAMSRIIRKTIFRIYKEHKECFATNEIESRSSFLWFPDYHSICVVASALGTPVYKLKAGSYNIRGQKVAIGDTQLDKYFAALQALVQCLD